MTAYSSRAAPLVGRSGMRERGERFAEHLRRPFAPDGLRGGFGLQLVVKPHPSLTLVVGGGEDGACQRKHPNEPKPWWLVDNFVSLVTEDWEGGHPWWEEAYMLGFLATLPSWLVLGGAYVFRDLRRRRTAS